MSIGRQMRYLLVIIYLSWPLTVFADSLSIHILDVGEGQAVLIHKNQRAILLDTGHAGQASSVLRRIQQLNIRYLDYLVLTHLHPDHASGYFRIHEAYPQARVLDNCYPVTTKTHPDMVRWIDQALKSNSFRRCVYRDDKIDWDGTSLNILWPNQTIEAGTGLNHSSLVILISHHNQQLLVMGDADKNAEAKILESHALKPVDILVVGHHGANDASSEVFLNEIRPRHAVISINKNNHRGYPSPATLQRLRQYSENIYKTYERGEVQFIFE